MREVECPKCGSLKVKLIQASYPKAYECSKCKQVFLKNPKALIDE
ncbi:MAG: transposase [Candidatus Aenigmatarchaeota archaeon]